MNTETKDFPSISILMEPEDLILFSLVQLIVCLLLLLIGASSSKDLKESTGMG